MVNAFDDPAIMALWIPAELDTGAQIFSKTSGFWDEAFKHGSSASSSLAQTESSAAPRGRCSGDSEYWHRLLRHGWLCRYQPSGVVFHYHQRDMAGLSKQIYSYMRGHVAALLVQYERSRNFGNLW